MNKAEAELLLRQMLGADKSFREGQWEAIEAAAVLRQRVLVVQRTGWGKSIVYFIATKILRDHGAGPALLISPLLSLMRNQIEAARNIGLQTHTINNENRPEWELVRTALSKNECDILLIAPERLANEGFRREVLPRFQNSIGLFIVDEAHCISDWGHDFRPDYRRIVRVLKLLPPSLPVVCTTATANDRVVKDVVAQISNLQVQRGPLTRASLKLFNIKLSDQSERLAWLVHFVPKLPGSGIIYCLTIPDTRRVAAWLQQNGITAREYNSQIESGEKLEAERMLLANECKALVATVALGMGFDKPDLGFVVHFQRPGSVIAYYQQVGRAGRAVDEAYGILLSGREDDEIQDYFIRSAFPPAQVMSRVLSEVEQGAGLTVGELMSRMNCRRGAIDKALKLLEIEGALARDGTKYSRTTNAWRPDLLRSEQVTQNRRDELAEIKRYVDHNDCLMEFLARSLDDPAPGPCGKCMNCTGQTSRQPIRKELVRNAIEFLRGDRVIIETRKQWPRAAISELQRTMPAAIGTTQSGTPSAKIPQDLRAELGRALSIYGDGGWGRVVMEGKYGRNHFSDELVKAAADLIRERWQPDPFPEWITCVPSNRHPELVADFAQRLAVELRIPFKQLIGKIRENEPQKLMENSTQQLRNLLETFSIGRDILNTPVIFGRRCDRLRLDIDYDCCIAADEWQWSCISFCVGKSDGRRFMIDSRKLLSDDGTAVVMLCSQLGLGNGEERRVSPLTLREWNALARKIHDSEIQHPGALVGMSAQEVAKTLGVAEIEAERIAQLVARGGGIALELEQLAASGIWCVTRADESYPARIRNTLKNQAPPVLFGTGDMSILENPAIGIVGSRNLDERGADFARHLGSLCARSRIAVASGGARGSDRIAMQGALDAGGYAVGILADSLIRTIRQPDVRDFIIDGRLVLMTPYRPDNGFSVGAAMGRNKIIYGAASFSVIVSSDYQKGGTWAGAVETLAAGWCPLFVRSGKDVGLGNQELINKGARPISDRDLEGVDDLAGWMKSHAASRPQQAELLSLA